MNYEILQMSFIPTLLPFYATQIINPFLNSIISANHTKVDRPSANGVNKGGDCFSTVESLMVEDINYIDEYPGIRLLEIDQ